MSNKSVRICPQCGGTSIERGATNAFLQSVGEVSSYYCKDCNFSSKMFPEVDESEVESIRKEMKENPEDEKPDDFFKEDIDALHNIDTNLSYGKFLVRKWWKIIGPMAIIFSFFLLIEIFSVSADNKLYLIFTFCLLFILGVIASYFAYFKKYKD